MRVCILYKDVSSSTSCKVVAESLAKGIQQQGHFVDLFNIATNLGKNISFYDYIAVGTKSLTFWWKMILKLLNFLNNGTISVA